MLCAAADNNNDKDINNDNDNTGPFNSIDANHGVLNSWWCKLSVAPTFSFSYVSETSECHNKANNILSIVK